MLAEIDLKDTLPAKSIGIDRIIAQRDSLKAMLTRISIELIEADSQAKESGLGSLFYACNTYQNRYYMPPLFKGDVAGMVKEIDRSAWETLMTESGMRTFLNASKRIEWDSKLKKGDFPEFTKENIAETFSVLYRRRREIFEEGVVDVFLRLLPKHGIGYKTNVGMAFKRRFIVPGLIGWSGLAADSGCNDIDDLIRCFCVANGKPEPDARDGIFVQVRSLLEKNRKGFIIENEWLSMKVYPKTGTGHVTIKNQSSIDALNEIIARCMPLTIGKMKAA